jgi:hypothetical protein
MSDLLDQELSVPASRRGFLKGLGVLGGTAVTGGALPLAAEAKAAQIKDDPPPWPWPYVELDPARSADLGHEGFYQGKCCYGTFRGVIGQLAEVHGAPYTTFPMDMMRYGEGGVTGWGSVCGTINGAAAAISLVCTTENAAKLINEIAAWYSSTELPAYIPSGGEAFVANASNSPLCHVSVSKWCDRSGFTATSNERKERCARLCADAASMAVALLNDLYAGTFVSQYGPAPSVAECMTCHGPNVMNNTLGKMDCVSCHQPHSTKVFLSEWMKSGNSGCDLVPDGRVDHQDLIRFIELLQK